MEKQINELNEKFYNLIDKTNDLNRFILITSYKAITNFIALNKQLEYKGTLPELLKKYESEAYVSKGKTLTDKQIIKLELKRIKQEYEKQTIQNRYNKINMYDDINNDSNSEFKRSILILVEYYLSQLKIFKEVESLSQENINFLKKKIAYIEILLNMKNGLYYETFLCFIDELERIEITTKITNEEIIKKKEYIGILNNEEKIWRAKR